MVTSVQREFRIDADVLEAVEARSTATGIPVDALITDFLRKGLEGTEEAYYENGIRLLRKPGSGTKVTVEDVIAIWEEIN